jgi:PAS domain S-box-containing protein
VDDRFRRLFENLPEALLVLSSDGLIGAANDAAGDLFRCESSELVGRQLGELWEGGDEEPLTNQLAELREQGELTLSGTGNRMDGQTFALEMRMTVDPDGQGAEAFVLARDLSERQRLEVGLAGLADLARLHEAEGSLPSVAAAAIQLARRMLDVDRGAVCSFQGDETVEWLASHRLEPLIAASSNLRPSEIPWLQLALESGQPQLIDRRRPEHLRSPLSAAADQLGVAAFAIVPIRAGEELTGALGLVWSDDPPELAQDRELLATIGRLVGLALANVRLRDSLIARQQALDESEARYRNLFQEAPEPILLQSWDGVLLDVNEAACNLYGRRRGELLGRMGEEISLIDRDERAELQAQLRRQRRGVVHGRGRRADGTTFPQLMHIAVTRLRGEERLLVQVRDLTEQERLQAELLQAQKMEALGQLISGVAHELNNPLSAIIAFSQLLRTDDRLPADMTHDADLLMQEADRTRRIVQNLLDFARQRRPERQSASLKDLIERTLELHAYALRAGQIDVHLELPDDLQPVHVDPGQIQQVLLNLTLNAIQAIRSTGRPGSITISAETVRRARAEHGIRLRVHDEGPGISIEARSHLFEPFFTTKPVGEGTGLGLSVSYGIVAAHGGRLWFEPGLERGATFMLELPAGSSPSSPASPAPGAEPAAVRPSSAARRPVALALEPTTRNGRREAHILAVDDEASVRSLLERALTRGGHSVTVAASGAEALQKVAEEDFDLLLVDHRMSGMDGVDFYQRMVELRPELRNRAVLMSGDTLNPALQQFAAASGVRMLAKPFDVTSLMEVIEEELARAERSAAQARG